MYYYYPEEDLTGAVGRPLLNHDVKIVDDDGREITEYDTRGELCMRGPSMFMGYFDGVRWRPERGTDMMKMASFHTGDVAMISGKTGLVAYCGSEEELDQSERVSGCAGGD